MIIKSLNIREDMNMSKDSFSKGRTLVYSDTNSKGKSTYIRFLFYALGYQIPQMKNVRYDNISTEIFLEEKGKEYKVKRDNGIFSVTDVISEETFYYTLPSEHEAFLAYIFEYNNIKVLKNILGIIYIDQDKGWSLLNRGKVIGKISFSIEELLAGINKVDCDDLLEEKKRLTDDKKKYSALLSIQDLSDEVYEKNGEIFISDIEKELQSKISLCNLKISTLKKSLDEIEEVLKSDQKFYGYIDKMNLVVEQDGIAIPVNRKTIKNAISNMEILKARRGILLAEIEKNHREKNDLKNKLDDYLLNNTVISMLTGPSSDIIINKQLANVHVEQETVQNLLDKVTDRLSEVNKSLKSRIKTNNPYIDKIYRYVFKYAMLLGVDDKLTGKSDYIFTDDLKSMSGAILQKMVFIFKVAFLKVIEEEMNTKLPMVLDSPRGKELDDENARLIDELIENELSENQVIIASIYEFSHEKCIKMVNKAVENRY